MDFFGGDSAGAGLPPDSNGHGSDGLGKGSNFPTDPSHVPPSFPVPPDPSHVPPSFPELEKPNLDLGAEKNGYVEFRSPPYPEDDPWMKRNLDPLENPPVSPPPESANISSRRQDYSRRAEQPNTPKAGREASEIESFEKNIKDEFKKAKDKRTAFIAGSALVIGAVALYKIFSKKHDAPEESVTRS